MSSPFSTNDNGKKPVPTEQPSPTETRTPASRESKPQAMSWAKVAAKGLPSTKPEMKPATSEKVVPTGGQQTPSHARVPSSSRVAPNLGHPLAGARRQPPPNPVPGHEFTLHDALVATQSYVGIDNRSSGTHLRHPPAPTQEPSSSSAVKSTTFANAAKTHTNPHRSGRGESGFASATSAYAPPGLGVPAHSAFPSTSGFSSSTTPTGTMPTQFPPRPSNIDKQVAHRDEATISSKTAAVIPAPPDGQSYRYILAAPLKLLRSMLVRALYQTKGSTDAAVQRTAGKIENYQAFLDQVCPDGRATMTEHDSLLPNIELAYCYPMSDHEFEQYEKMVEEFEMVSLVKKLQEQLCIDKFSPSNEAQDKPGVALLEHFQDPADLVDFLSPHYNLSLAYDVWRLEHYPSEVRQPPPS